jgi:hypothetical protein
MLKASGCSILYGEFPAHAHLTGKLQQEGGTRGAGHVIAPSKRLDSNSEFTSMATPKIKERLLKPEARAGPAACAVIIPNSLI